MPAGLFTVEFYEEDGRAPVEEWMEKKLTDVEHAALLSALEHVLSHLGNGVCGTEWGNAARRRTVRVPRPAHRR